MSDLKELIKEYPELGEVIGEFENRVSYLENSQHFHEPQELHPSPVVKEEKWMSTQWDTINQLRAMVLFLQEKVNTHIDASKKRSRGKY